MFFGSYNARAGTKISSRQSRVRAAVLPTQTTRMVATAKRSHPLLFAEADGRPNRSISQVSAWLPSRPAVSTGRSRMRGAPGRHFLPPEKKSGEFPGSAFSMLQNAICLLSGLAADSLSQTAYEGSIPFARSYPTNLWKMGASGIFGR